MSSRLMTASSAVSTIEMSSGTLSWSTSPTSTIASVDLPSVRIPTWTGSSGARIGAAAGDGETSFSAIASSARAGRLDQLRPDFGVLDAVGADIVVIVIDDDAQRAQILVD